MQPIQNTKETGPTVSLDTLNIYEGGNVWGWRHDEFNQVYPEITGYNYPENSTSLETETKQKIEIMDHSGSPHQPVASVVTKSIPVPTQSAKRMLADLLSGIIMEKKEEMSPDTFVCAGRTIKLPHSFNVKGVGSVNLPIREPQLQSLFSLRKGKQKTVDTSARNTKEIDASKVMTSKEWNQEVQRLARKVSQKMGIQADTVSANLHKVVLYKQGGFYKKQGSAEREDRVFATMVIQIPTHTGHKGGSLVVDHLGVREIIDHSKYSAADYKYTAFYCDCEHELLPITRGNRVCLIYNLVCNSTGVLLDKAESMIIGGQISSVASQWSNGDPDYVTLVLDHNYKEPDSDFSFNQLEGKDRTLIQPIMDSKSFGLYLALIEKQVSIEDGDLLEESITIGACIDAKGNRVDKKKLFDISNVDSFLYPNQTDMFKDIEPYKEEREGHTGNAGVIVDYWYRRVVLFLVPSSRRLSLFCRTSFVDAVSLIKEEKDEEIAKELLEQVLQTIPRVTQRNGMNHLLDLVVELRREDLVIPLIYSLGTFSYPTSIFNCVEQYTWDKLGESILSLARNSTHRNLNNINRFIIRLEKAKMKREAKKFKEVAYSLIDIGPWVKQGIDYKGLTTKVLFRDPTLSKPLERVIQVLCDEEAPSKISECISMKGSTLKKNGNTKLLKLLYISLHQKETSSRVVPYMIDLLKEPSFHDILPGIPLKIIESSKSTEIIRCIFGEHLKSLETHKINKVCPSFLPSLASFRLSQIGSCPVFSWRFDPGEGVDDGDMREFLMSERTSFTISSFSGVSNAKSTAARWNRASKHYSLSATSGGRGKSSFVTIRKTKTHYDTQMAEYKNSRYEVATLERYV